MNSISHRRDGRMNRRRLLQFAAVGGGTAAVLAACDGEVREIIREVPVEVIKEVVVEVPGETKIVEVPGETQIVEVEVPGETKVVEVEKIVEKIVPAEPALPQQVTLEVFIPAHDEAGTNHIIDTVVESYKAKFPHVRVDVDVPPFSEWTTKLNALIAADEAPDIFIRDDIVLPAMVARNVLLSLDEFWRRDEFMMKDMAAPEAGMDLRTGKRYGTTRSVFSTAFVYNEGQFEAAGVEPAPNDEPWTWDEYVENMMKLTADNSGRSPADAGFDSDDVDQWGYWSRYNYITAEWTPWTVQNGGTMIDATGTISLYDSPEVIEAMTFMNDLTWRHKVSPTPDQATGLGTGFISFLSGKCSMFSHVLGQEASWPTPARADFEAVSMVHPIGVQRGAGYVSHQMVIYKGTTVAEEAWQFIAHHTTDEASSLGMYTVANYGLPGDLRFWDPELLRRDAHPRGIDKFVHAFTENYASLLFPNIAWVEWYVEPRKLMDEAFFNREPMADALRKANPVGQEILDRAIEEAGSY
jgi:ABC-type glycerol-3-phosphate transport system substrate-binding protein